MWREAYLFTVKPRALKKRKKYAFGSLCPEDTAWDARYCFVPPQNIIYKMFLGQLSCKLKLLDKRTCPVLKCNFPWP